MVAEYACWWRPIAWPDWVPAERRTCQHAIHYPADPRCMGCCEAPEWGPADAWPQVVRRPAAKG